MVTYNHAHMDTKCIAIKVGKPLWKAITTAAMEEDKSLAEVVVPVLEKAFGGLVAPKVKAEVKVAPAPVSVPAKPTPEEVEAKQRSCKHSFVAGARACVKCGWVPPIMG